MMIIIIIHVNSIADAVLYVLDVQYVDMLWITLLHQVKLFFTNLYIEVYHFLWAEHTFGTYYCCKYYSFNCVKSKPWLHYLIWLCLQPYLYILNYNSYNDKGQKSCFVEACNKMNHPHGFYWLFAWKTTINSKLLTCFVYRWWCMFPSIWKNSVFIWVILRSGDKRPLTWTLCLLESAGQDCCIKNYSPFSPQRKDVSTPSSLYMESREFSVYV